MTVLLKSVLICQFVAYFINKHFPVGIITSVNNCVFDISILANFDSHFRVKYIKSLKENQFTCTNHF